eukprot:573135-Pelagomonas_calceolata.AAC.2
MKYWLRLQSVKRGRSLSSVAMSTTVLRWQGKQWGQAHVWVAVLRNEPQLLDKRSSTILSVRQWEEHKLRPLHAAEKLAQCNLHTLVCIKPQLAQCAMSICSPSSNVLRQRYCITITEVSTPTNQGDIAAPMHHYSVPCASLPAPPPLP